MKVDNLPIIETSTVCLRFFGDDLDPDKITAVLGVAPTASERKGDIRTGKHSGKKFIAETGGWRIIMPDSSPEDLDRQIVELLLGLPNDMAVWNDLANSYSATIYCGLFMRHSNDNLYLSPKCLLLMGERGLELVFDIYSPLDDDEADLPH